MSNLPRFTRQISGLIFLIAVFSFTFSAWAAAAQPPVDIRGEWVTTATAAGTTYAQTLDITSEDLTNGQISGSDTGANGSFFTVTGTVLGNTLTMVISDVGYHSNSTATITGSSPSMQMTGTFADSHNINGTFSAQMTIPAVINPPLTSGSSVTLVAPIAPSNNAVASTGVVAGVTTSTDPNPPSDNLPLLPLGLAALLLLGLGGAAAAGLVPGVSGLGGSSATSGAGSSETVADNTTGQQIERMKVMQDTRPDFMPSQPATPPKYTPADPFTSPADLGTPPAGQQTERAKIMQDQQTKIAPSIQQDPPAKAGPDTGPASRADPFIRAEAPANPATDGTVASATDVPADGSPPA
jgi:hypothetical protein